MVQWVPASKSFYKLIFTVSPVPLAHKFLPNENLTKRTSIHRTPSLTFVIPRARNIDGTTPMLPLKSGWQISDDDQNVCFVCTHTHMHTHTEKEEGGWISQFRQS